MHAYSENNCGEKGHGEHGLNRRTREKVNIISVLLFNSVLGAAFLDYNPDSLYSMIWRKGNLL
jgi:hypothetical protein